MVKMKFKFERTSMILINMLIVLIWAGIALDYFGYNTISSQTSSMVMLATMGVIFVEAGLLKLMSKPPMLTTDTVGKYFMAAVFVLLSAVVVPPLFGMVLIGGATAGIITLLGVLLAVLLSFT